MNSFDTQRLQAEAVARGQRDSRVLEPQVKQELIEQMVAAVKARLGRTWERDITTWKNSTDPKSQTYSKVEAVIDAEMKNQHETHLLVNGVALIDDLRTGFVEALKNAVS